MVTLVPLAEPLCRASMHLPPRPRYMVCVPPPEVGVGVGVGSTPCCGANCSEIDRLAAGLVILAWVALTVTWQVSGFGKGRTSVSVFGVVAVPPPVLTRVSPPNVHEARQNVLTSWLPPLVMVTFMKIVAGLLMLLLVIRQLAAFPGSVPAGAVPVPLQKPATLAFAALTPTVIAPAASNPVKAARNAARGDIRIIKCLSAVALSPLAPICDASAPTLVYTRFTG